MSHGPEQLEAAQISHSLALLLSTAAEPNHNGEFLPNTAPPHPPPTTTTTPAEQHARGNEGLIRAESPIVLLYVKFLKAE